MAKENFCQIIGPIRGQVHQSHDGSTAQWRQIAMRRSGKTDFVPLIGYDEVAAKIARQQSGQWMISKGILSTRQVIKRVKCPYCGSHIDSNSPVTEVLVIDTVPISVGSQDLTAFKEMSNVVKLLGTVCSPEITVDTTENGLVCTRYQLAVNRKYNCKRQPNHRSDYPSVKSYARQAEDDRDHLQQGSQCFIEAGIQVCNINRPVHCTCRDESGRYREVLMADEAVDIVTHSVEYLNNCRFDKKE